jgi:hypothetical protein
LNGVRTDNRLANLREVTRSENNQNSGPRGSRSGVKGVRWRHDCRKWEARISRQGVCHGLGFFAALDEARDAYTAAARRLYGEFARPS